MISGPVTPDTARMSTRRGRKIPQTSQASIRSPPTVLSTPFPQQPCHHTLPQPPSPIPDIPFLRSLESLATTFPTTSSVPRPHQHTIILLGFSFTSTASSLTIMGPCHDLLCVICRQHAMFFDTYLCVVPFSFNLVSHLTLESLSA